MAAKTFSEMYRYVKRQLRKLKLFFGIVWRQTGAGYRMPVSMAWRISRNLEPWQPK